MQEQIDARVAELTAEVEQIVAQLAQLKANPPADVAAAQAKVDAAIENLRTAKSQPTSWHTRTADAYKQLREFYTLESIVASARRELAITGRSHFDQIAALNQRLYEVRRWLATAQEQKQTGGTILFIAND
jgi:hypothetical protein